MHTWRQCEFMYGAKLIEWANEVNARTWRGHPAPLGGDVRIRPWTTRMSCVIFGRDRPNNIQTRQGFAVSGCGFPCCSRTRIWRLAQLLIWTAFREVGPDAGRPHLCADRITEKFEVAGLKPEPKARRTMAGSLCHG